MGLQLIKNKMWYLKLFVILKLAVESSANATVPTCLSSFKSICSIDIGVSDITALPGNNLCSAIALYSNNSDGFKNVIPNLRGSLPFVYVLQRDDIAENLCPEKVVSFVTETIALIQENNISALVIDNIFMEREEAANKKLEVELTEFIAKLKDPNNPAILIGLAVTKNTDLLTKCVFDIVKLNTVVDFYLINSFSYSECTVVENQPLVVTSTVQNLNETLQTLQTLQIDLSKTIITVDILVDNSQPEPAPEFSYSYLCSTKQEANQTYCTDTLENYFNKGKLVFDYKLPGVLLRAIDRDDHNNSCKCDAYPVATAIIDGAIGTNPSKVVGCTSFGVCSSAP